MAVFGLLLTFTFPVVLSAFVVGACQTESAFGREITGKL